METSGNLFQSEGAPTVIYGPIQEPERAGR